MTKRIFLTKIIAAQMAAFLISGVLNGYVFLNGTPLVRADVKENIVQLPQTIIHRFEPQVIPQKQTSRVVVPQITSTPHTNSINSSVPTTIPTLEPLPTTIFPTTIIPTDKPEPTRAPAPTGAPTTQQSQSGGGGASATAQELETISIINQKRQSAGLSQLVQNGQLTTAARRQSADNAQNGQCDHTGSDGSDFAKRARDAGFTGQPYGETVACRATSPQQAVDLWWGSPGHHAILTNSGIKQIGLGWVDNHQTAVVGY